MCSTSASGGQVHVGNGSENGDRAFLTAYIDEAEGLVLNAASGQLDVPDSLTCWPA